VPGWGFFYVLPGIEIPAPALTRRSLKVPRTAEAWARFILSVFVAGVVINAIVRRVPQLAALTEV